jgi:hypothetical protein
MLATSLSWLSWCSFSALVLRAGEGNFRCILVKLKKLELPYLRLFCSLSFPLRSSYAIYFQTPTSGLEEDRYLKGGELGQKPLSGTQSVALGLVFADSWVYDRMPHCARSLGVHTSDI